VKENGGGTLRIDIFGPFCIYMKRETGPAVQDSALDLTSFPSTTSSYVGEKMKERVGEKMMERVRERIVVTTVNRDVAFIYIKY
jgi:hypothetical protein